jgi:hypothetical protein
MLGTRNKRRGHARVNKYRDRYDMRIDELMYRDMK